jgi:anti-sigma factor ChrR (cupin superfamily)
MTDDSNDQVEFDVMTLLALALAADTSEVPSPDVKRRLMARIESADPLPAGFSILESAVGWLPHPVPGIRMKVLSIDRQRNCATLLFDVEPGSRFPAHHHDAAEECYVISGSVYACGRRLVAGDFLHADGETDHDELWTEEGCRVLLVVQPEHYFPEPIR